VADREKMEKENKSMVMNTLELINYDLEILKNRVKLEYQIHGF
jgi:hypothetical protein